MCIISIIIVSVTESKTKKSCILYLVTIEYINK